MGHATHIDVESLSFHHAAATQIYTLSLHDALPICEGHFAVGFHNYAPGMGDPDKPQKGFESADEQVQRLKEIGRDTSELQSQSNLVCRLLLEKKNNNRRARLDTVFKAAS